MKLRPPPSCRLGHVLKLARFEHRTPALALKPPLISNMPLGNYESIEGQRPVKKWPLPFPLFTNRRSAPPFAASHLASCNMQRLVFIIVSKSQQRVKESSKVPNVFIAQHKSVTSSTRLIQC